MGLLIFIDDWCNKQQQQTNRYYVRACIMFIANKSLYKLLTYESDKICKQFKIVLVC